MQDTLEYIPNRQNTNPAYSFLANFHILIQHQILKFSIKNPDMIVQITSYQD